MKTNRVILLLALLAIANLGSGCQSDGKCTADSRPYKACVDGNVYWHYENCDMRGELAEACVCGCNEEGSGCLDSHPVQACVDGRIFWYHESCGKRGEPVETCLCRCNQAGTGCSDCSEWKLVGTFPPGDGPEEIGVVPGAFWPYDDRRVLFYDTVNGALKWFEDGKLTHQTVENYRITEIRALNGQACLQGMCPDPYADCPCDSLDDECTLWWGLEGWQCVSGTCLLPCGSDSYCQCEETCENGSCIASEVPIDEGDDCCLAMLGGGDAILVNRDGDVVSRVYAWSNPQALVTRHDGLWVNIHPYGDGPKLVHLMSKEGALVEEPEILYGETFSGDGQFILHVDRVQGNILLVSRVPAAEPQSQPEAWVEIEFEEGEFVSFHWIEGLPDGGLLVGTNVDNKILVRLDPNGTELYRVGLPGTTTEELMGRRIPYPYRIGEDGEIYCMISTDSDGTRVYQLQL